MNACSDLLGWANKSPGDSGNCPEAWPTRQGVNVTDATPQETWRPVVDWEGFYEVSDMGRVKSLARIVRLGNGRLLQVPTRILKGYQNPKPTQSVAYVTVTLNDKNGGRSAVRSVHRMVADAFLGELPKGMHRAHRNGDPTDNRLVNIRFDTPSGNSADRVAHGTMFYGVNVHNAVLTDDLVREIRRMDQIGIPQKQIAEELQVSKAAVAGVRQGKTWKHVA